ncbi:membrane protein [Pedobacter lusitanus]|uniref:Membrane protein n=1 Tax=Pedobacter lusitanus TaxID=1503925 RepID=A0A0D0GKA2_9SPHI|nr:OmpA family protein [Pedobacter lusitanus]KIO76610.1 membrane protein [Pedobacter lusitanus]
MKQKLFKSLPVALAALFIGGAAQAQEQPATNAAQQFSTWSIGVNAGVLTPTSPLGGKNDFSKNSSSLGYGLYIKKQFTPYFSLKLDGIRGKLKGDNSKSFNDGKGPAIVGGTTAFETELNYAATLSAEVNMFNIDMFRKQDALQLFVTGGAGLAGYKPKVTVGGVTSEYPKNVKELVIPVGLGARFKVSEKVNFNLGWSIYFVDGDNVDGTYRQNNNDKFSYAHAGLEFALGKGKQLAFHNPVAATYDEAVQAKNIANSLRSDLDAQKSENAKLRTEMSDLLKDTDGDGVADKLDKCPNTPSGTVVDGAGCPLVAPTPVVTEKVIITDADRKVVKQAIKDLEFDLGKSTIRAKSYTSLNRVANLLVTKNFSLKLAGHTDNTGRAASNMKLSKDRAESVKAYLVSQGANASRIEATGYGQNQPIASNKNAAGRQKNRRVEFTLY